MLQPVGGLLPSPSVVVGRLQPLDLVKGLVQKVPAAVRFGVAGVSRVEDVYGRGPLEEGEGAGIALEGPIECVDSRVHLRVAANTALESQPTLCLYRWPRPTTTCTSVTTTTTATAYFAQRRQWPRVDTGVAG